MIGVSRLDMFRFTFHTQQVPYIIDGPALLHDVDEGMCYLSIVIRVATPLSIWKDRGSSANAKVLFSEHAMNLPTSSGATCVKTSSMD
jgi:hypothetical protein